MRISDWSSDVCSSDLVGGSGHPSPTPTRQLLTGAGVNNCRVGLESAAAAGAEDRHRLRERGGTGCLGVRGDQQEELLEALAGERTSGAVGVGGVEESLRGGERIGRESGQLAGEVLRGGYGLGH